MAHPLEQFSAEDQARLGPELDTPRAVILRAFGSVRPCSLVGMNESSSSSRRMVGLGISSMQPHRQHRGGPAMGRGSSRAGSGVGSYVGHNGSGGGGGSSAGSDGRGVRVRGAGGAPAAAAALGITLAYFYLFHRQRYGRRPAAAAPLPVAAGVTLAPMAAAADSAAAGSLPGGPGEAALPRTLAAVRGGIVGAARGVGGAIGSVLAVLSRRGGRAVATAAARGGASGSSARDARLDEPLAVFRVELPPPLPSPRAGKEGLMGEKETQQPPPQQQQQQQERPGSVEVRLVDLNRLAAGRLGAALAGLEEAAAAGGVVGLDAEWAPELKPGVRHR